jgi:TetR/AcrR family transcriptional repressor of nem operon
VLAAADAWHSRSFDGVGVAEICRLAKVNKGSFFHFFESKNALLVAVIERHGREIRTFIEEGPLKRDVPPLDRVERYLRVMGARMREQRRGDGCSRGCPIGNLVSELGTRDPEVREAAARALEGLRSLFADAFREAEADGSLPEGADVEVTADAIIAYMQGLAVLGKAWGDNARLERVGGMLPVLFGRPPLSQARPAKTHRTTSRTRSR